MLSIAGGFFSLGADMLLSVVNSSVVLMVRESGEFLYQFLLYNEYGDKIYSRAVSSELNYVIEPMNKTFKWVDLTPTNCNVYAFIG